MAPFYFKGDFMAQYDGSIRINTQINTKQAQVNLATLENRMVKTADKIASLRSKMDSLKDAKIPTTEYAALEKEFNRLDKAIGNLVDKQIKFLETGGKKNSTAYKRMEYELAELSQAQDQVISKQKKLEESGKAFTLGSGTEEYKKLGNDLKYAENEMELLKKKHDLVEEKAKSTGNQYKKLGKVGKSSFSAISKGAESAKNGLKKIGSFASASFSRLRKSADKSGGSFSKFSSRLKGILSSLLIFNWVTKAFNAMVSGMKEGFSNLYNDNKKFKNSVNGLRASVLTLKNSFASAFAPIATVAIPYLQSLVNAISSVMDKVAQFTAAITGQKTYLKAVKQTTAAIEEQGKKASKANKKQLSGLDKLNNLSKEDKDDGGAGAGSGAGGEMFKEAPIDSAISDIAEKVKDVFGDIFDVFKKAWDEKGNSVIKAAKGALESLKTVATSVGSTFYEVFTGDIGLEWAKSLLELLRSMLGVIKSIASAFSAAWNGGAGEKVVKSFFTMLTNINTLLSKIADSFSKAFSNGIGVQIWTNILEIVTGVFNIIGNLAQKITEAWTNSGLGTSIWSGILGIINIILTTINSIVTSTANWAKNLDFTPLLTSISTLLTALQPLAENIGEGLKWFWDNVLLPVASWTIQTAVPEFLNMLSAAINVVNSAIEALKPLGTWIWENFLKPLGKWAGTIVIGAIKKLTDLFNKLAKWISDNKSKVVSFTKTLDEKFKAAHAFLMPIITKWGTSFSDLWNNHLKPFITSFVTGILDLGKDFLSMWNTYVNPLIKKWGTKFTELWTKYVKPAISGIIDVCNELWKNVLKPIVSWLIKQLVPKITDAVDTISSIVSDVVANISTWISGITDIVKGVIKIIKALVKGDWKTVWEGFGNVVKGVKKVVKTPINAILGFVEKLVNGVISMLNTMIIALNSISFEIPDWVPKVGGNKFGLNLKEIKKVEIPRLATGAVIPPNKEFLAVLGDQKHGTNIEAPLDTIKQALREELKLSSGRKDNGVIELHLTVECEGYKLLQLMQRLDAEQYNRTGRPTFQM